MKDVSIEYAHIYTNQKIAQEHKLSLVILNKLRAQLEKDKLSYSLVILVDDYSFPDTSFDYNGFVDWLEDHGHTPDLILRESLLIPVCDEVLSKVGYEDLKVQITDHIQAKKYPCLLFIAAWYMLRLGEIQDPMFDQSLQAKKLMNILPESLKPFEDKALEIIKSAYGNKIARKIKYKFFDGRLVA